MNDDIVRDLFREESEIQGKLEGFGKLGKEIVSLVGDMHIESSISFTRLLVKYAEVRGKRNIASLERALNK